MATLAYIIFGLIITTMCIDLVGSAYIRDIHFYGRTLGKSFMTFGGKVVHLGEVFGYVAFLQRNYGITAEQLEKLREPARRLPTRMSTQSTPARLDATGRWRRDGRSCPPISTIYKWNRTAANPSVTPVTRCWRRWTVCQAPAWTAEGAHKGNDPT